LTGTKNTPNILGIMHNIKSHSHDCEIFPFLLLPYHVRHDIYGLVLEYPDLGPVFARIESQRAADEEEHEKTRLPKCALPTPHVPARLMSTPGILLCNRQIASEAREAMYFKTFTLRRPPPYTTTLGKPMDITEFISEDTLRNMRRVEFVMNLYGDPRRWSKTMEILLDVWSSENHLRKIDVTLEQPKELQQGLFWDAGFSSHTTRMLSMVRLCSRFVFLLVSSLRCSGIDIRSDSKLCKGGWHSADRDNTLNAEREEDKCGFLKATAAESAPHRRS
jgi:hypothetical protein